MYKLLIIDDEEPEREGMAKFIPWEEYGITLVGTAWNGVEGIKKIRTCCPDIVMTDIKMPVMDGIELIRRTKKEFLDIEFIVLSGYGEYEYTSQAMEEGVRHYILKPCDEEKIRKVIEKVKFAIEEKHQKKEQIEQYSTTIRNLLPRAREQVFYNLLMGREEIRPDYRFFAEEVETGIRVCVLAIRLEKEIDCLVQFILQNILEELLESGNLVVATAFSNEMVFLLKFVNAERLRQAVKRMSSELTRYTGRLRAALSTQGKIEDIRALYLQTEELFCMDEDKEKEAVLTYELFREEKVEFDALVDYAGLDHANDLESILSELYLVSCKMKLKGYSNERKRKVYQWIGKVLCKGEENFFTDAWKAEDKSEWEMLYDTAGLIEKQKEAGREKGQEEKRMEQILTAVFEHLDEQELSIRYLAREVLFMNEDYFGRLFQRCKKVKFSSWLLEIRIELARKLLQYSAEARISDVAGLVGFPEDGQYFSKVFRKATGLPPSQYREEK